MTHRFSELTFTPAVKSMQMHFGSSERMQQLVERMPDFDQLGERESNFIADRDSFYMSSISESGWPYIQHRGGEKGFLHVISAKRIAFANFSGNAQYQSLGNINHNNKVSLFLVDYPNKRRLKILGRARTYFLNDLSTDLVAVFDKALSKKDSRVKIESVVEIELDAFDWNCPQHLTPRFSEAQLLELGLIKQGDIK
ncbi:MULTISPECIES: pyridoxamine 5'-phosphate oxidase family protein [unclassified Neptuniibacter]|uniref:pyridoxamine 5'-phosphate oxidase family protein n=1 Tax=unclassified Neptuniibacter TaxID=2630693 RepID=UPI000C664FD5|nr:MULTISPECIES: pyridoxamine 5'-phosphate oxidase family protein [unclassified Neptuniibacter]MAY42909.1 pyridoxamine 5'-phosphate oxidase [Oceanospirillaceae bacterium]|tara:strand:- start:2279 stop:2869 length:591 start_codon:yes stop_codon:yes gene_type:complete